MAEDQTLEETQDDVVEETSEETAEKKTQEITERETQETKPEPTEEMITIPRKKWQESQKEAVRLAKELKAKTVKPVETIETETGGETLDQIVEKKVQEKVAPFTKQQQEEKVDKWLDKNPEAYDYLKEIEDNWASLPGKTVEEKLENSLLLAKKDAAKQAGKKEMAFSIFQKEQASTSGGTPITVGESLPELTEEEKKVAQSFGIKEEVYAKSKLAKK